MTTTKTERPDHSTDRGVRHPHYADLFDTPLYPGAPIPRLPLPVAAPTQHEEPEP